MFDSDQPGVIIFIMNMEKQKSFEESFHEKAQEFSDNMDKCLEKFAGPVIEPITNGIAEVLVGERTKAIIDKLIETKGLLELVLGALGAGTTAAISLNAGVDPLKGAELGFLSGTSIGLNVRMSRILSESGKLEKRFKKPKPKSKNK